MMFSDKEVTLASSHLFRCSLSTYFKVSYFHMSMMEDTDGNDALQSVIPKSFGRISLRSKALLENNVVQEQQTVSK